MKIKHFTLLVVVLTGFLSGAVLGQEVDQDLEAFYPFDGNLHDASGNGHDLYVHFGQITFVPTGEGDQAIRFDGASGLFSQERFDVSDHNQLSFSLWLRSSTIKAAHQTVFAGAYIGFSIAVASGNGAVQAFMDGSSFDGYYSDAVVVDGTWHHILIQSAGSETYVYIDGVLDGSLEEPLKLGNGAANNILVAGRSNLGLTPFTGDIKDVRIYTRILSEKEITDLAESDPATSTSNRTALQPLHIYPNPATHQVRWNTPQQLDFQLYGGNGKLVRQGKGTEIDVSDLASGIYYLRVEEHRLKKVVVQRGIVYP